MVHHGAVLFVDQQNTITCGSGVTQLQAGFAAPSRLARLRPSPFGHVAGKPARACPLCNQAEALSAEIFPAREPAPLDFKKAVWGGS